LAVKQIRGWLLGDATIERLAIARAFAVLPLLVLVKLYLLGWYNHQGIKPLAETEMALRWLLVGPDVLLCVLLAPAHRLCLVAKGAPTRWVQVAFGDLVPFAMHATVVVVTAVNVRVNQIYGQVLNCDLLAYADNLLVMRDSIVASITPVFVATIVIGLALFFSVPYAVRWLDQMPGFGTPLVAGCVVAGAGGVFGGGSYMAFRGIYNYGLKSDPVLELVRTYRRADSEGTYPEQKARLEKKLAEEHGSALAFESLRRTTPVAGLPELAGAARGMSFLFLLGESTPAKYVDAESAPFLTRLAKESIRLPNYFTTAPFTFDAQFAMFYSEPIRGTALDAPKLYGGPPRGTSLAEVFHAHGYATSLFESSYLEFQHMAWLFQGKGIDTLVGADDLIKIHAGWSWGAREEDTVDRVIAWIDAHKDKPFFAVYNPVCPHHPYHSPGKIRPFSGHGLLPNFKNALHYTDENIGRLLAALDRDGLTDHTVIVALSDHGETVTKFGGGHGLLFSSGELRVPMYVRVPGVAPRESPVFSNHLDLAPTLAGMFGFDAPKDWLGRDLTAREVKPRILFVGLGVGLHVGLIDEGVAISRNEKEHATHVWNASVAPFLPLAADPHEAAYAKMAETLDDKIKLRHLEQALH
jgi:hypothetical protein